MTQLGYSTSGFSWNNPIPVDTTHWLSVNDNCTMGNTTKYERDDNGNVTKQINPDGTYTLARYNDKNMPLVQVDESKNVVINEYDESGVNVVKQYQSLSPVSNADAIVNDLSLVIYADYAMTQYTYYPASETAEIAGLIRTITDAEDISFTGIYTVSNSCVNCNNEN